MLPPIKEETLEFHIRFLKRLVYPIALLLLLNVGCVLYAVGKPNSQTKIADRITGTAAETSGQSVDSPLTPSQAAELESSLGLRVEERLTIVDEEKANEWRQELEKSPSTATVSPEIQAAIKNAVQQTSGALLSDGPSSFVSDAHDLVSLWSGKVRQWNAQVELNSHQSLSLHNPYNATVAFLIDGKVHRLSSGQTMTLDLPEGESGWNITFHRGGNFGKAVLRLESGTYRFHVSQETGWDLVPQN